MVQKILIEIIFVIRKPFNGYQRTYHDQNCCKMKKLLLPALLSCLSLTAAQAQTIYGVTIDDKLYTIPNAALPAVTTPVIPIIGITAGQTIKGLDVRPLTGELYALGYNAGNGNAQLYVISPTSAVATPINTVPMSLNLGTGTIAFDFNPAVDRIRVMGNNGKNYRLNPATGVIAATDADLNYSVGDPNQGATPTVGACAYTNSYLGSETTTLYDYDQVLSIFTTQQPPNAGSLNTIGPSMITVNTSTDLSYDMDIWFDPATHTNKAYLAANPGTNINDRLYTIDLNTGAATSLGLIGALGTQSKAIAVAIDHTVPPNVTGQLAYGLTRTNRNLFTFDTDTPQIIRSLKVVTGVTSGQTLQGMDMRPANRQLYGLGYNAADSSYQLYTINPNTAVATPINPVAGKLALGNGRIGFDFNPVVDRIRVTSSNGANYRLVPTDGSIAATDQPIAYMTGDVYDGIPAHLASVAYLNSYPGATATQLYGIDDSLAAFVFMNPPNNGTLTTVAQNLLPFSPSDLTNSLDFYFDSVQHRNLGYLAANSGISAFDSLYHIDSTGMLSLIGLIGNGISVADIAVQIRFTNTIPSGLAQVNARQPLQAYPTPVRDVLTLHLPGPASQPLTATVFDLTGRLQLQVVIPAGTTSYALNVSQLPAGIFTVRIQQDGVSAWYFKGLKQ